MITFITKRALFPFSSWLPLAIAAPTPISALVHSSTLVTAGLYLMMRFSVFFYTFPFLMRILVVVSLFTSFYAGINAVFETDLKKLIALSTLSHLGFIGLAFSSGFISLAFFHLLTHALFKRLLFMVMGDIMTNLSHSQDIRCLSRGVLLTPGSRVLMSLSLANLLGLPSLRGFFSKDLILERLHFSSLRVALLVILLINVCFTYFYTLQLFYFMFQRSKSFSFSLLHSPKSLLHSPFLALLGFLGLPFSAFFFIAVTHSALFVPVPLLLKRFPIVSIRVMLILLFVKRTQFSATSPSPFFFFRKMAGLSLVFLPIASSTYYTVVMSSVRSFEQGLGGHVLNDVPSLIIQTMSSVVYSLRASTSLKRCLLFIPLFVALATVVSV
jgi:NADH-ubiquinone oxidoreductase chain 5